MSVDMSGDALTATMHVAHLSGGTLTMPPGLNSVVIEIGCSDRDTMDDWELDTYFPNSFLLSFEPLVDKYALLLAKGTRRFVGHKRDAGVPLGRHHQRGIVLPLAVSPAGGAINFTVSRVAGCSSMAQIHPNSRYKSVLRGWGLNCEEGLERRIVPSITLEQALRLTGELPVLRLKIDAQGVDLQLVRSVPPAYFTRRVETVELEFASDACKDKPLYVGQASASEVSAYLASLGYSKTFTAESAAGCEETQIFQRKVKELGRPWPHLHHVARQWREAASPGYCGETRSGLTGDCQAGSKGSFWLGQRGEGSATMGKQEKSLLEKCLALCAGCARCRFVSFSAKWHDCGWFHECALDRLKNETTGFLSGSVSLSKETAVGL